MEKLELKVNGMMCKNCVKHVEEAAKKVKGVKKATASLLDGSLLVEGENFNKEDIINNITEAGYDVC